MAMTTQRDAMPQQFLLDQATTARKILADHTVTAPAHKVASLVIDAFPTAKTSDHRRCFTVTEAAERAMLSDPRSQGISRIDIEAGSRVARQVLSQALVRVRGEQARIKRAAGT